MKIWVHGHQVKPGDVILKYRGYASGDVTSGGLVKEIKPITSAFFNKDDFFSGSQGILFYGGARKLEWYVEREGDEIKETISEYPSFCLVCGEPAYVGLNEIDHKNKDTTCAAWRKS